MKESDINDDEERVEEVAAEEEMGETSEAQVNYDKLIEEGKIPADYVPKDIVFKVE